MIQAAASAPAKAENGKMNIPRTGPSPHPTRSQNDHNNCTQSPATRNPKQTGICQRIAKKPLQGGPSHAQCSTNEYSQNYPRHADIEQYGSLLATKVARPGNIDGIKQNFHNRRRRNRNRTNSHTREEHHQQPAPEKQ
jgi:hypothetical protein